MTLPRRLTLATLALVLALPAAERSGGGAAAAKTLYKDGPSGRYLIDGQWLFRARHGQPGPQPGFAKQTVDRGLDRRSRVPNAWNAEDDSTRSFAGTVGWYRKDFQLPTRGASGSPGSCASSRSTTAPGSTSTAS